MADVKVDRWRSIPYAEPPLGELRFLPPRPRQRWAGVWDSRGQPSTCTQISGAAFGNFSGEQVGTGHRNPSIHPKLDMILYCRFSCFFPLDSFLICFICSLLGIRVTDLRCLYCWRGSLACSVVGSKTGPSLYSRYDAASGELISNAIRFSIESSEVPQPC